MKYTIHCGIAALVHVECEAFPLRYGERKSAFIYMAEGKPIEKGIGDPIRWDDLPLRVKAAINKHFGTVFALPIERRGEYLENLEPIVVEVDDEQG